MNVRHSVRRPTPRCRNMAQADAKSGAEWDAMINGYSRKGTQRVLGIVCRPTRTLIARHYAFPALKRWAKIYRPGERGRSLGGKFRKSDPLQFPTAFHRLLHGDLVGVLDVAAGGDSGGDARDFDLG